jgi:hypothetical protein
MLPRLAFPAKTTLSRVNENWVSSGTRECLAPPELLERGPRIEGVRNAPFEVAVIAYRFRYIRGTPTERIVNQNPGIPPPPVPGDVLCSQLGSPIDEAMDVRVRRPAGLRNCQPWYCAARFALDVVDEALESRK